MVVGGLKKYCMVTSVLLIRYYTGGFEEYCKVLLVGRKKPVAPLTPNFPSSSTFSPFIIISLNLVIILFIDIRLVDSVFRVVPE